MSFPVRAFVLAALSLLASHVASAAPANDRFANRMALTGTNLTVTGSNVGAGKENGEPAHAGNLGGKSVWWTWTPPGDGDVVITTDGSLNLDTNSLDTLLAVYVGSTVSALTVVATNDDHAVNVTSRVRYAAKASTAYQIAVDGFNDGSGADSGNIQLTLTFIPEPILRPINDNFASRILLSGLPVRTTGANTGATREPDEPVHADALPKRGDTSVWWSWTAPSASNVMISTAGSSFDTLLALYTGSTLASLVLVTNSDDIDPADGLLTSAVSFAPAAGRTYQIAVDGYDGASGQVVLQIVSPRLALSAPRLLGNRTFQFTIDGAGVGRYEVDASSDCQNWTMIGSLLKTNVSATFIDPAAASLNRRFYRAR